MKKILFIIDEYTIGGVTAFVRQYAKLFQQSGYSIIVAGQKGNIDDPEAFFSNAQIVVIPSSKLPKPFQKLQTVYLFFLSLSQIYSDHPSIEIVYTGLTWSTLYSFLHPKSWSKRRVATFYGCYHLEYQATGGRNKLKFFLFRVLQYLSLLGNNKIVTFSNYAKELIKKHFGEKISDKTVIVPGIVGLTQKKLTRQAAKKQTGKPITLLNFGRAEPRKGLIYLLQAIALIKDQIPVKAYIASPVDYYSWFPSIWSEYERLNLFDTVHFIHKVNDDQKIKLAGKADLFVMPSLDLETFGLTILEAMELGLPVVGFPTGAIPEILREIDENLLATDISARALADRVLYYYYLSDDKKLDLHSRISEILGKKFSPEIFTSQVISNEPLSEV